MAEKDDKGTGTQKKTDDAAVKAELTKLKADHAKALKDAKADLTAANKSLDKAQADLKAANYESGGRRIDNNELQEQYDGLKTQLEAAQTSQTDKVTKLEKSLSSIVAENKKLKIEELFRTSGIPLELMGMVDLTQFDPEAEETKEKLVSLAKTVKASATSSNKVVNPGKTEDLTIEDWSKLPIAERLASMEKSPALADAKVL